MRKLTFGMNLSLDGYIAARPKAWRQGWSLSRWTDSPG